MILRIRNVKNFLLSTGLVFSIIFGFQNCGQDMTSSNSSSSTPKPPTSTSLAPCIASGCPQGFDYIQVEVANTNPISFLSSGASILETSVDVSGYCNTGGFPGSHLYYSIKDLTGNTVVANTAAAGVCSGLGKFRFPVSLSGLSGSNNYQLNVLLRAVDSAGLEFDNALGLNKRQVGLSPRTGI